jgi:hypothetical protein
MSNGYRIATFAALFLALSLDAAAGEGLWMPQQLSDVSDELKAAGIDLPSDQLAQLNGYPLGAMVQIPGCSGAFVSADGLILTNHHCTQAALQYNSTGARDLTEQGFLARERSEELWNGPLSRAYVTTSMTDVTDRMLAGIPENASNRERYEFLDEREKKLISQCEKAPGTRCRVAWLYDGVRYSLVAQKELLDIRLVYAPARGIGEFGGDTDNWMWPRHSGDFALYRAYVAPDGSSAAHSPANVPFRPAQHLRITLDGVREGDPVLVVGYPAKTSRYRTARELQRLIDIDYPRSIRYTAETLAILENAGATSNEIRLKNSYTVQYLRNNLKYMRGVLDSLSVEELMARKRADEAKVREQDPAVLDQISALQGEMWRTDLRDSVFFWMFRSTSLFRQALMLYRFAMERPKKDMDRQWGYQDRDLPKLRESIERSQLTHNPQTDRAMMRYFLQEAASLPDGQRIAGIDAAMRATGATDPDQQIETLLDQLYRGTAMADLEVRKEMLRSPMNALRKRKDPFIELAAAVTPLLLDIEAREEETFAAMTSLRPRYMQRLLAIRGGKVYPDANGTLRYSWGVVEGFAPRDAVRYAPVTTVPGIVEKNERGEPYRAPAALLEAIREKRFGRYADANSKSVPVNFLASSDSSAGSSGSPLLNSRGELVGVLFDGNYEAMGSDLVFRPSLTRAINADVRYLMWVLDAVEGAEALVREMGLTPQFAAKAERSEAGAGISPSH